jgi:isoleucyl-tRNA synthetase
MGTVNALPKMSDLREIEGEILDFWKKNNIYMKVKEKSNNSARKFYFLDGPPYPSSPTIHLGTAWNKIIKDTVLRYKRMKGFRVTDTPGYDCHGLPIEVMIERKLGLSRKSEIQTVIGIEKFVELCRQFAKSNSDSQTKIFQNLGIFMDWENPYYTMNDDYIEASWNVIKRAYEKGLLVNEYEVLHWCPRCETTLADYEVSEYRDIEDPSIYVKFKVKDREEYLLIWTTTPWTIPSNVLIMVDPTKDYVKVKVNSEIIIVAKERLNSVMIDSKVKEYEIIEDFKGEKLLGLSYLHPLEEIIDVQRELRDIHRVVDGREFVTMSEGTGLVHSSTGHGREDFIVGKRNNVPIISLIDDKGFFVEKAGKYKGKPAREANEEIIKDLERANALFHKGKIVHKYPVCWRCKTPLLLRATSQWFIKVSKLKDDLLYWIDKVNWVPEWSKTRIENMVKEIKDWVISRQRYWGTPLPIWVCSNCNNIVVISNKGEIVELGGKEPKELHKPWIDDVVLKCNKCGFEMRRVQDVADVWFDSGVSFFAQFGKNWEKMWKELGPVDFITEGHDQLRGWFFSLLRTGIIAFSSSPYKNVLTHGFMLDEQGREMHKSLGNYVEPEEVINKFGREVLRLWLLSNRTWEDAKFSWKVLEEVKRNINIIWNTYTFASIYMNLDNFDPTKYDLGKYLDYMKPEDLWLISRYNSVIEEMTKDLDNYNLTDALKELTNFIINEVSRFYIRLTRRRAWVEGEDPSKLSMYLALYYVLEGSLRALAPFLPIISEKIYQSFVKGVKEGSLDSVHLEEFPSPNEKLKFKDIEFYMNYVKEIYEASANARSKASIKLRWPLRRGLIYVREKKDLENLATLSDTIRNVINVKEIEIFPLEQIKEKIKYNAIPKMQALGMEFKGLAKKIAEAISERSEEIAREILKEGKVRLNIDGREIVISKDHVSVKEEFQGDLIVEETSFGAIAIDKNISEEEEKEGLVRDIVRRIQFMRKQLSLAIDSYIDVFILPPNEDRRKALSERENYIKEEVRAKNITYQIQGGYDLVEEWEIEGEKYLIGIKRK